MTAPGDGRALLFRRVGATVAGTIKLRLGFRGAVLRISGAKPEPVRVLEPSDLLYGRAELTAPPASFRLLVSGGADCSLIDHIGDLARP